MKHGKFQKLSREERISLMFDLIGAFQTVRKPTETALLLQDLLTANEIRNVSIRLRIAKLLLAGKKHREIQDEINTSFATITKVKTWLDQGGEGLKQVISKLPLKWDIPKNLPRGPIEFHLPQTMFALIKHSVAVKQRKRIEKFEKGVSEKEATNRLLKKSFDEYYKEKALEKKSNKKHQGSGS